MAISYKVLRQNIKKARADANMTQEKAAEKLGMSMLNYGRLERCERKASMQQINRMAYVFGVSPYTLLDGALWKNDEMHCREQESLTPAQRLALLFENCSPEDQELCWDICRRIICGKGDPGDF